MMGEKRDGGWGMGDGRREQKMKGGKPPIGCCMIRGKIDEALAYAIVRNHLLSVLHLSFPIYPLSSLREGAIKKWKK